MEKADDWRVAKTGPALISNGSTGPDHAGGTNVLSLRGRVAMAPASSYLQLESPHPEAFRHTALCKRQDDLGLLIRALLGYPVAKINRSMMEEPPTG